ncbi:Ig-like domain-containing protein, partial [Methanobrevibacter sp.]
FIYLVLEGEDGRPQFLDDINILVTVGDITYPYVTSSYPLVINGLDAGEYTINAVSMGTDIYGSVRNDTEKFIVEKNHLTISASVSAPSVDAGEEVVFSNIITAPERTVTAGTVTYYIDGEPIEGDRLSNLTPGSHYLVAKYSDDINFYDAASEEVIFNVVGTIDYVIDAPEVTYPADATISFQSSVPGRYTLSVNDIDYFIVVESAGQIIDIVIPGLNAGSYDIALKANIENYYPIDLANAYTLVVKPVETELVISPKEDETVYYGDVANITVSITEGATGTITYYVDGVEKDTIDIRNEFGISGLSGGEHTVVAEYSGNENYKAVNSTAITITVNPLSPTLTVTTQKIRYGQNATISIGLAGLNDEKLDGVVKVTIDGKEYNVTVSEGVGTLTVSGLNLNTVGYPITAEFAGNDNYTSAINDTEEQEVNPFVPLIEVMPIEIIYGEDAVVNITLTGVNGEKLDGNVYVQLDISPFGEYQNVTVTDGVGKFTAIGLNAGTYALKGYFLAGGNYGYASFVKDDAINVIKSNSSIELKANATDIEYGETVSISAELLCGDVTGEILYYVDERMYEGYTIEGLDLDELGAGEHIVSVRYLGDENYNPSDYDSLTITVSKSTPTIECTVSSNNITYGESVELSSTLSPIAVTGKVIYYLDGEAVNGTTLSGLAVGKHNVVAKYPGDDNFNAVESNTVTITVKKAIPDITVTSEPVKYPNDAVVNFALTGINGTALPGTTIRVTVNGVTYAVVTDEEGKASLTLKGLDADEYPIEAVSVATDLYESASDNTANVVVEKGSLLVTAHASDAYPYVGDEVVFTYTLSATQGGLTGGTVTYYVDGVAIDGDRLSNLTDGTHILVANYTNDPNYKDAVSLPVTIHVLERAVVVSIECDPVAYPNNGTITLTASAAGNYTVIVGEQSHDVEVAAGGGSVTISVAKMNVGTYDVEVKNSDGFVERFEDAYTVIPGNITYTLEAPTVTYPENVILYFGASAMGEYIININGTEKTVTIWGNEIQGIDIGILDAGVYDIGLRAIIDNYNPIDIAKETTLTVLKAETEFTISPKEGETVYYGAVANLTVSLTEGATGTITYYVDGVEKATIDVANEFGIAGLGVGEHTVTAKYNGDKNHLANESTTTITVNKIPLTINIEGHTVSYPNDARVLVDVYGPKGVGLDGITVLVTVNNVTYVVETGASDLGTPLIIKGLDAGEYPITAVSIENDNYQAATYAGDAKVVVNRGDTTITVFAANQTIKYGETTEVSSVLSPGDATGDVTYYVDEASIEGTTVSGLDVGVHTVVAIYDGNKNYKDAWSDPIIITVIKATPTITINANATNITYGDFVDVWAEIPEIRGVVPVTYYVDGEAVEGNTSGKTLSVYDAGNLTVYVTFAGNEDFNPCESEKLTITINKADPTVTVFPNQTTIKYGETIKLEAMVVPDDPSAVVTYYVDGEAIEGDIVSGLGVGTHAVVAKYQGNKNYNAAESETVNITVNKAIPNITVTSEPVNYPNDAALNIALTAVNGTAIPGTTIRVTVNGVTYAVVTDEEGKASLTLKGLTVNEYPIEAVSVATDLYESASDNTANVVVEKGSLLVTAHVSDAYPYVGDVVVFTYALSATQGGLTGGTVTYYVDGVAIDGDRLSNLTAGYHNVFAKYTGDPNFNDAESDSIVFRVFEHA